MLRAQHSTPGQGRTGQARADPSSRLATRREQALPSSVSGRGPDDLKLNVQHMNYVSCLIKWFHLHARAPHACAAGSLSWWGEQPVASCLAGWNGPTWATTQYSREPAIWGPQAQAGRQASRSARWLSLNKNGYCVFWTSTRSESERERGKVGTGCLADCSGYLCVAFVRIINVNLS